MKKEYIAHGNSDSFTSSSRSSPSAKRITVLFYLFLMVTAVALFIPLNPRMPSAGLDGSWESAMNEAVAHGMSMGGEIAFTYGPYASVGTRVYSPSTDFRMMAGSSLIGISYSAALLFLMRGRARYITITLLLFLATFGNPELILLSYAFSLVVCVVKESGNDIQNRDAFIGWRKLVSAAVMWSALGLLPVVKGSLLVPFLAADLIPVALLVYRGRIRLAAFLFFMPFAAAAALWVIAGQRLAMIPAFLRDTAWLTSGYTEAMSTSWGVLPSAVGQGIIVLYIALSVTICLSVFSSTKISASSKWALTVLCGIFLLLTFKHGFVAVGNVSGVFATLTVLILILGFLYLDRYLIVSVCTVVVVTVATSVTRDATLLKQVHDKFGVGSAWAGDKRADILAFCVSKAMEAYPRTTYKSTWETYKGTWEGISIRLNRNDNLYKRFVAATAEIRRNTPLPMLNGSADIYEFDQSVLIASGNRWNPRPLLQSYSAYTPELAWLDEEHLRGSSAPDWVWFELQTIDNRLPSLDDGLSWPAFVDNYSFVSFDGRFVLLHKNQTIHQGSNYERVLTGVYSTGATVSLPQTDSLLFGEVDLKPTFAGKLAIALFKPPQLRINLGMSDGKTRSYRVVSGMMKTDFLLSPLVSESKQLSALAARGWKLGDESRVLTISIAPAYGGSFFWSPTYELTVKKLVRQ